MDNKVAPIGDSEISLPSSQGESTKESDDEYHDSRGEEDFSPQKPDDISQLNITELHSGDGDNRIEVVANLPARLPPLESRPDPRISVGSSSDSSDDGDAPRKVPTPQKYLSAFPSPPRKVDNRLVTPPFDNTTESHRTRSDAPQPKQQDKDDLKEHKRDVPDGERHRWDRVKEMNYGWTSQNRMKHINLHQCVRDGMENEIRMYLTQLTPPAREKKERKIEPHEKRQRGGEILKKKVNQHDADRMTPLHYAARNSSYSIVELLVEHCADVNIVGGEDDITPLHLAARFGRERRKSRHHHHRHDDLVDSGRDGKSVIDYLVSRGAKVNAIDKYEQTPLHLAAMRGNEGACRALLRQPGVDIEAKDAKDYTPLHVAAIYNQTKIARILIRAGADVFSQDVEMSTPLHHACREGSIDLVNILIESGARTSDPVKMIEAVDCEGSTCLHLAVENKNYEVAKLCLEKGAKLDLPQSRRPNLYPIHLAAMSGDIKIVKLLLKHKALIEVVDDEGATPLHKAASFKDGTEAVDLLLDNHAHMESQDKDEYTPLLLAVSFGHVDTVARLLERGANLKATDKYHKTAIYLAAEENKPAVLEQLLARPEMPSLINMPDEDDYSPLHVACEKGHPEIVKLLLGKTEHINVYSMNDEQQSPIHLAAKFGRTNIVRELLNFDKSLLKEEDENSNTPLHLAAMYGHDKATAVLLQYGASVDARNYKRWTPLDLAASKGFVHTCTELLNFDAPVDAMDLTDTTPLHLAAQHGHPRVVQLLLDRGALIYREDTNGFNCLDHAIENNHPEVAMTLIDSPHWKQALRNFYLLDQRSTGNGAGGTRRLDTPMRKLIVKMPDVALRVFDRCMDTGHEKVDPDHPDNEKEKKNPDHLDYVIKFDFEFLDDTYNCWMQEEISKQVYLSETMSLGDRWLTESCFNKDGFLLSTAKPYTKDSKFIRENHPLAVMVNSKREELLDHPLVIALLSHKWQIYGRYFYYVTFGFYAMFLAFLTAYIIQAHPPQFYSDADKQLIQNNDCGGLSEAQELHLFSQVGTYFIMALAVVHFIKEILQFIRAKLGYITWGNIIEITIFVTAFLFVVNYNDCQRRTGYRYDWQWQLGAVSVFLGWLNLLLFIRKFPRFGIYVVMFTNVLYTFVQFFFVFLLFVVAFGLAFFALLQQQVPFETAWQASIKTFVMMIGEFDYNDIFNDSSNAVEFPVITYIIFIAFVIAMSILIMNLLTGLAVDDTQAALAQAALARRAMQIQLTLDVERLIPFSLLVKCGAIKNRMEFKPNRLRANPVALFFSSQYELVDALKTYLNPERKELDKLEERQEQLARDMRNLERTVLETNHQVKSMLHAIIKSSNIHWQEEDYQEEDEVAQIQAGLSTR